jgi:hypothetical protein
MNERTYEAAIAFRFAFMNFLPLTAIYGAANRRNTNTSLGGLLGERGEITPRLPSSETDY